MVRRLRISRGYTGPETKFIHIPDRAVVTIGDVTDAVQRQVDGRLAEFLVKHEYAFEIAPMSDAETAAPVPAVDEAAGEPEQARITRRRRTSKDDAS